MWKRAAVLVAAAALVGASCSGADPITSSASDVTTSSTTSTTSSTTSTSSSTTSTTSSTITDTTIAPATTVAPTTVAPTTVAPTTVAPTTSTTTTLPLAGCGPLAPLATGVIETAVQLIDVDADGFADTVRSYAARPSPSTGDWHLRVELAAGGGVDLTLPFDPAPAGVTVLGGTYIGSTVDPGPEGARPAIFVTVGAGASASIIGLYRLAGCALTPMTGGEFPVGGGVVHTEHLRCEGVAGTSLLVYVATEYDDVAATHTITQTAYTRTDNALTPYGTPVVSNSPTLPIHDLIDNCGVDGP